MTVALADGDLVKLDQQLCFLLYAVSRGMTRAYQPMLAELGLTYPQYLVLMVLWEWHDAPVAEPTVSALGQRLLLDSGTLTPLLKRLEQQGLVLRERDHVDERRVLLGLTPAALALRPRAIQWLALRRGQMPFPDDFVAGLRDDLRRLLQVLG